MAFSEKASQTAGIVDDLPLADQSVTFETASWNSGGMNCDAGQALTWRLHRHVGELHYGAALLFGWLVCFDWERFWFSFFFIPGGRKSELRCYVAVRARGIHQVTRMIDRFCERGW